MALTILYRGDLSSCNYACDYCPFAKKQSTREQLAKDKADLQRFCSWVEAQEQEISILFTPWGEALIRGYYREAITSLSHLKNVTKVAIQTNFSCSSSWLADVDKRKTAFWITYHPTEISLTKFIQKCQEIEQQNIAFSVGMVGTKESFNDIKACKDALDESCNDKHYLWVNAYKREANYYREDDVGFLTKIDPHFNINNQVYPSLGKSCRAGETAISVDGEGNIQRCHFIKETLGNIYSDHLDKVLKASPCSNETCSCYIGYTHLHHLALERIYGDRILERIACGF